MTLANRRSPGRWRAGAATALTIGALVIAGPATAAGGALTSWGANDDGEQNAPVGSDIVQIAFGLTHGLALRDDGTVTAWGSGYFSDGDLTRATPSEATVPGGLGDITQVTVGGGHSAVLRADGTVHAWGRTDSGQSPAPSGLRDVVQIAGGGQHTLALHADGTVSGWGWNNWNQLELPEGLSDVVQIAAGTHHGLALHRDGSITAWGGIEGGEQYHGQAVVPPGLTAAVQIAAGDWHSVALLADGTVAAWGAASSGQTQVPSDMAPAIGIAAGLHNTGAVHADGTVTIWGGNDSAQLDIPASLAGVSQLGLGRYSAHALSETAPAVLTVDGTIEAGSTITAVPTGWRGSEGTVSFQWFVGGALVPGATAASYTIADADAGKPLLVQATSTTIGALPLVSSTVSIPHLAPQPTSAPEVPVDTDAAGIPWIPIIGAFILVLLLIFVLLLLRRRRQQVRE